MPAPNQDRSRYPLPSPIDDGSRICVKIYVPNIGGHREALIGAIYNLTRWYSWQYDDAKQGRLAAAVWQQIFADMMETFYDSCPDDKPCHEFPPSAQFIEWFPNNPYTEPDLVTDGYNAPAWYLATPTSNLLLGTQTGDVATDLSRFPPGSLPSIIPASGLPRFRLNLGGEGIVTLHLLNIFGGSVAQITIDDNISTLRYIDSDRDQIAVPFETATTTPVEIEIKGAGAHHIDIIIVSQINDSIPFLHHGGGLRKVELCGFESMVTMPAPLFRFTEACNLEISYNGSDWSIVPGWDTFAATCFTGPAGAPGEPGAPGAPGADGAQGEPGIPGAPGVSWDQKCATAQAIVNGVYSEKLALTWESIDFEISEGHTLEEIRTAINPLWPEQHDDCSDQLDALIQYALDLEAVSPGSWRESFEAAATATTRNVIAHGLSCWLCETGQFPGDPQIFIDAALYLEGFTGGTVLTKWLGWVMTCNRSLMAEIASHNMLMSDCADCSTLEGVVLSCDDWAAQFDVWTHEFDFFTDFTFWTPVTSGFAKSKLVTDHGFQPFQSPPGSGNFSCIGIVSDSDSWRMSQMDIGLESAYGFDGNLQIQLFFAGGGGATIAQDFLAGADFFTTPVPSGETIGSVEIQIVRTDGSCTSFMDPAPTIRYVTFYGVGSNPF